MFAKVSDVWNHTGTSYLTLTTFVGAPLPSPLWTSSVDLSQRRVGTLERGGGIVESLGREISFDLSQSCKDGRGRKDGELFTAARDYFLLLSATVPPSRAGLI